MRSLVTTGNWLDGKKESPRLHELAPMTRGSQDAGSRNLESVYLTISVLVERLPFVAIRFGSVGNDRGHLEFVCNAEWR